MEISASRRRVVGPVYDFAVPLLPRFTAMTERIEDERRMGKIILAGADLPDGKGRVLLRRSADGHDPARLRGLPAIGRNVTGATRHTDPVKALLAKESARGWRAS